MGVALAGLVGESVPQVAPEQPVPDKVQVTVGVAEGSFVTVAVKFCVPLTATDAVAGAIDTVIGGAAMTVIVAVAGFVPPPPPGAGRVHGGGGGPPAPAAYTTGGPRAWAVGGNGSAACPHAPQSCHGQMH